MGEFRENDSGATRLWAIEKVPRFVADERVLDALAPRDRSRGIERDKLRAYRLILLLLQVNVRTSPAYRPEAPWEVPVCPDSSLLSASSGLALNVVEEALADLRRVGVLVPAESGERLAESLFVPNPSVAGLDWPWIVERLWGMTSGLMVTRALADLLRYPGEWTPVLQPELAIQAAYSSRAVRDALQLIEQKGVIERNARQKLGMYRFSARARGIRGAEIDFKPERRESTSPTVQDVIRPPELFSAPSSNRMQQVERSNAGNVIKVSVGGIELQVPQGSSIRPVVWTDGRTRLSIILPNLPEMIIELPSEDN